VSRRVARQPRRNDGLTRIHFSPLLLHHINHHRQLLVFIQQPVLDNKHQRQLLLFMIPHPLHGRLGCHQRHSTFCRVSCSYATYPVSRRSHNASASRITPLKGRVSEQAIHKEKIPCSSDTEDDSQGICHFV
jgi:hypothetical protein